MAYAYFDENDTFQTMSTSNGNLYIYGINGNVVDVNPATGLESYYKLQFFAYGY